MSWTKRALVTKAFEKAGLASYVFDLSPEQLNSALQDMDAMMATWAGKGLNLGYALTNDAEGSDLDDDSGLQAIAVEAVYLNLAPRIAGAFGKAVPPATVLAAKQAYDSLLLRPAMPRQVQYPSTMPRGAGNRRFYGRTYMLPPNTSPLQIDEGGDLNLGD